MSSRPARWPAGRRRCPGRSDRRPSAPPSAATNLPLELVVRPSAWTMNRLAAMHDWPLFCTAAGDGGLATASSRSADGSTMNGSLPPSSSTDLLDLAAGDGAPPTARPARCRSAWPPPPAGRAGWPRPAPTRPAASGSSPSGKPPRGEQVLQEQRRLRHVRRVLEQADVARHQRRRGEPDRLPEREVPRHDGQHRAERLVA